MKSNQTFVAAVAVFSVACSGASRQQPPTTASAAAVEMPRPDATRADIVDTAIAAGSFKTLVTAIQAAGLESTLRGPGPFTVFAPTDEAFAKLPPGTLDSLLKPENKAKLRSILMYHVVSGRLAAADVVKTSKAKTVEGRALRITSDTGGVRVDDANVVKTDIAATNGVIHVVDRVMLPQ